MSLMHNGTLDWKASFENVRNDLVLPTFFNLFYINVTLRASYSNFDLVSAIPENKCDELSFTAMQDHAIYDISILLWKIYRGHDV